MDVFKSSNAPFAVVILASALGWYISTLQSTLEDRLSLVYAFNREGHETIVLRVDNISRKKSFSGEFNILCINNEGEGACLKKGEKSIVQYRVVEPYNLSNEVSPVVSPDGDMVKVEAWIPPSASLEVELPSNQSASDYRFQYLPEKPDENRTMPEFYVSGLESFIIQNFDSLLIWTFISCLSCLTIYLATSIAQKVLFFAVSIAKKISPSTTSDGNRND